MREKFIQYSQPKSDPSKKIAGSVYPSRIMLLLFCAVGCGTSTNSGPTPGTPTAQVQGPQTYFSPYVAGTTNGAERTLLTGAKIYEIDDTGKQFSQSTFQLQLPEQQGPQVINAGVLSAGNRGLLSLGLTVNYTPNSSTDVFDVTTYDPPKTGSFAVELAGQGGGLVQLAGQPMAPLVAATQCPNLKTSQTFQFITIPAGLVNSSVTIPPQASTWNPMTDTAYGSVDISSDGSAVTFNNIHQHTLPSIGGAGSPAQQPLSSVKGACGPTVFGSTIAVGQLTVQNPRPGNLSTPPQASVAIGSTGLLLEHNGSGDPTNVTLPGTSPGLSYDNTLGAGTGAIGLPRPSSPLNTGALIGAQYLGFVYGAGVYAGTPTVAPSGWSSHLASFGFSNTPSSCASIASATGTLIYGGDFTKDDPTTSSDGFGNCDLAIDLGTQDASNNGLYPRATVWLGVNYAANSTGKTYSFPAVAIAGQLNGKYALFLLGADTTQPWAIYLLQSN